MDTMAIAGADPVGELVDRYVIYDDGTAGQMQVLAGTEPTLSRPGRFVSRDEYSDRLQELREGTAAHLAGLTAEDEARHRADYEALRAAGVAEVSARRMAGYTGPVDSGEG
ncbi:hypothetical protein B0E38_01849 [Streptomyces sp. 111WW2]|uniref:hypothetical protein n=1 Tax=Streptomyces sp. 111WW2 TaxID=1945515 RepID=UPI000D0C753A|nr:hypothetical protein [Streptomyces sp. 111WW2]PSK58004.1 hypothetical protein B0E38_01849 [Streptomyces sp. 111WW2]